jgi:hypothetical protein
MNGEEMILRISKRGGAGFALALALALALTVSVATGSSLAATQHWASASQVPYGSSQSFSGEATGAFWIQWYLDGAFAEIDCTTFSTSGTVENPAGGGSATIGSEPFELGNCALVTGSHCAVEGGSIAFAPMSKVINESGEDQIRSTGNVSTSLNLVGAKCGLAGSRTISAAISANVAVNDPGEFEIISADFSIGGKPAEMYGRFALKTPSGDDLALSSTASPGAPRWYLDSADWNPVTVGETSPYASKGPLSFDMKSELFGTGFELACSGSANGVTGSLSNPTGGGAGIATAAATLGECTVPITGKNTYCLVQAFTSIGLAGAATEVAGTPVVEFSPPEGSGIATFVIAPVSGKKCSFAGTYAINGKLIASSEGDGYFDLSGNELKLNEQPATASGRFALESEGGKTLRLQP